MCYDVETQLRRSVEEALRKGAPAEDVDYLRHKLDKFLGEHGLEQHDQLQHYLSSGYTHPKMPVITNDRPEELQYFNWGLIPHWTKDKISAKDIAKKCLNARSETFFEKPAFKFAASEQRCIIPVSGYYEYHWLTKSGSKKIPYFIHHRDRKPLWLAGLWEKWTVPGTSTEVSTCTIMTTQANATLAQIHNRKPDDPRMLVILELENVPDWLAPYEEGDEDFLKDLCQPYPDELLAYYPVRQLKGALGIGDVSEASQPFEYPIIGLP